MSERFWKFLLRVTGCTSDGLETYETTQPWVTYHYPYTDRALALFDRSFVRCICCVCGERRDVMVRESEATGGHHPGRTAFLTAHRHPGGIRTPQSWELPLRNPAALREGDMEDVFGVVMNRAHRAARETSDG